MDGSPLHSMTLRTNQKYENFVRRTGRMKKTLLRRDNLIKLFAESLAVMFSGGIGFAADTTGISLILFPEIAALAFDVFSRLRGKWATKPPRHRCNCGGP